MKHNHSNQPSNNQSFIKKQYQALSPKTITKNINSHRIIQSKIKEIEIQLKKILAQINKYNYQSKYQQFEIDPKLLIIENQKLLNLIQRIHPLSNIYSYQQLKQPQEHMVSSSSSLIHKIYQIQDDQITDQQILLNTKQLKQNLQHLQIYQPSQNHSYINLPSSIHSSIQKIILLVQNINIDINQNSFSQEIYTKRYEQNCSLKEIQDMYSHKIEQLIQIKDDQIIRTKYEYEQKMVKLKDNLEKQIQKIKNELIVKNAAIKQMIELSKIKQGQLLQEIEVLKMLSSNLQQNYQSQKDQLQQTIIKQQKKINQLQSNIQQQSISSNNIRNSSSFLNKKNTILSKTYLEQLIQIRNLINIQDLKAIVSIPIQQSQQIHKFYKSQKSSYLSEKINNQETFIQNRQPINDIKTIKNYEICKPVKHHLNKLIDSYKKIGKKVQIMLERQQICSKNIEEKRIIFIK